MATKPAKSSKTVVAAKPAKPAVPAKSAKPAAAKIVAEKKAAKLAVVAKADKPVAAAKPAAIKAVAEKKPAKPAVVAKPVAVAKPSKAVVPAKPAKEVTPAKPAAAVKPVTEKKPEKQAEIAKTAKTAVAAKPKWSEIRELLLQMKEETLREISKTLKNGADTVLIGEPSGDIYDQASSERDRELGLLLGDREREKVHAIDDALLRIDEDEYGICEECEEDIPLGRLKAMPFTRHCVKCKSDLEKFQAQTKRFEEERAYREIPLGSEEEDA